MATCGGSASVGGHAAGPERVSAEPRKARFFAEQKMRPNEVLKKLLYLSLVQNP
jgi:hypothetical protein